MKKLQPGIDVMVYADPITQKNPEGKARLIRKNHGIEDVGQLEFWTVRFLSDKTDVMRWVAGGIGSKKR